MLQDKYAEMADVVYYSFFFFDILCGAEQANSLKFSGPSDSINCMSYVQNNEFLRITGNRFCLAMISYRPFHLSLESRQCRGGTESHFKNKYEWFMFCIV